MSYIHVQSQRAAESLRADLASASRVALDCEAAGFHRYSDKLCLVQLSVGERTYVIDPLAFDPTDTLREPLQRRDVEVVMHGADFDLRLLSRDLGIRVRGLVDTQVAAALLGEEGLGLAALLESRLGVKLSKKYQRADWAERPLSDGMLEYAASDTRHLDRLSEILYSELAAVERAEWAEEECLALEGVAELPTDTGAPDDPVVRIKGAQKLSDRQVTALRAALEWRDEIARARDRALFRVVADGPLVEAVARMPKTVEELRDVRGFPRRLAGVEGKELIRRLRAVASLPEDDLVPYPRTVRRTTGRPPPELEELVEELKAVRNAAADRVRLPRGTLLANAALVSIARATPTNREELLAVEGMRLWKIDILGDQLLEVLSA